MAPDPALSDLEEHRFPCDTCGSDLRFDPGQGLLVCDHCGNTQDIGGGRSLWSAPLRELDLEAALTRSLPEAETEETRVLTCPNCAAQVAFDPGQHAAECPFCATPVVTGTGAHRHIKPQGVLPFSLDEAQARRAMTEWLGNLWFAPNGLQEYARKGRRMQGIYVPYWTYDADTRSTYTGQRGEDYYVTRTVRHEGKTRQIRQRKTRWHPASGRVSRFFDDILVLASRSLPRRFTEALEPWDLSRLEPYQPEYLAGFRAEAYTVSLQDGFAEAREHMDRMILRDVKFDIGGDRQRVTSVDTHMSGLTFKHLLLPVWLAAYRYRGRSYRFVVNGRTGRVQGERPWSAIKITLALIALAILAGIAGYLIAINQPPA